MRRVAIIGGGPAGLMAAEVLAATPSGIAAVNGLEVAIFDAMPSVGRKFLIARLRATFFVRFVKWCHLNRLKTKA